MPLQYFPAYRSIADKYHENTAESHFAANMQRVAVPFWNSARQKIFAQITKVLEKSLAVIQELLGKTGKRPISSSACFNET
jgi:hypothetical protein